MGSGIKFVSTDEVSMFAACPLACNSLLDCQKTCGSGMRFHVRSPVDNQLAATRVSANLRYLPLSSLYPCACLFFSKCAGCPALGQSGLGFTGLLPPPSLPQILRFTVFTHSPRAPKMGLIPFGYHCAFWALDAWFGGGGRGVS